MARTLLELSVLLAVSVVFSQAFELSLENVNHLFPIQPRFISQEVQLRQIPTKVIRITKTVAVKVPVPYPVKVPHHVPVPVPVHQPVAVPVPQIIRIPERVPVTVEKPVPIELPQQVPLLIPQAVAIPRPVEVPRPYPINRPVIVQIPKLVPFPQHDTQAPHLQPAESNHVPRSADYADSREAATNQEPEDKEKNDEEIQKGDATDYQTALKQPQPTYEDRYFYYF